MSSPSARIGHRRGHDLGVQSVYNPPQPVLVSRPRVEPVAPPGQENFLVDDTLAVAPSHRHPCCSPALHGAHVATHSARCFAVRQPTGVSHGLILAWRCPMYVRHHGPDKQKAPVLRGFSGARYWDRTSDLFRVREARYRCANRAYKGCSVVSEVATGFEPV